MVRDMPCVDHVEQLYDTYVVTKLKRRPFAASSLLPHHRVARASAR
jgi:hypothetical protein